MEAGDGLSLLHLLMILTFLEFTQSLVIVTGATGGVNATTRERPLRHEINGFAHSGPPWFLYVQALQRLQDVPRDFPMSYYQIAGIHGYPISAWDGVEGNNTSAGYCMHNSVLFPTWHRPYLALFEQVVWQHAQAIAVEYPVAIRDRYIAAARSLRLPYWDWSIHNLPTVVSSPVIVIDLPNGTHAVRNPLFNYVFPLNMTTAEIFPDRFDISGSQISVRHYSSSTRQDDEQATAQSLRASSAQLLNDVYQLLTNTPSWTTFSAYYTGLQQNPSVSLERVHNAIHTNVGGSSTTFGHMSITYMSAFDPIFWLHHANVDRLTAIWQALNPDTYVEPTLAQWGTFTQPDNTTVDTDTALTPFHAHEIGNMWSARTVRDLAVFGYTYPELIDWNLSAVELRSSVRRTINELYNPATAVLNYTRRALSGRKMDVAQALSDISSGVALNLGFNNANIQWTIRVSLRPATPTRIDAVYFFAGLPLTDENDWSSAANLIGSYSSPLHGDPAAYDHSFRQIDIGCTHTLLAAQNLGLLPSLQDDQAVLAFLKRHLRWKVASSATANMSDALVGGMTIRILKRNVVPRSNLDQFPSYGAYQQRASVLA